MRPLTWRHRVAPLDAAIWVAVLANLAVAFSEPREGLLGRDVSARRAAVAPTP